MIRAVLVSIVFLFASAVHAAWPGRTIKLVVPYPPGGATDVIGRVLAQRLTTALGQQAVVEHRSGAGGKIGAEAVAKAAPDGYTLLMGAQAQLLEQGAYAVRRNPEEATARVKQKIKDANIKAD